MIKKLFTSESVTEGHPDKMCDQISDAILDAILAKDDCARVACEVFISTGMVLVSGEISTLSYIDVPHIVRKTIQDIGYIDANYGFDYKTCSVMTSINEQSSDISIGVDIGGAGDQGMMFGYANSETEELMPLAIDLSHKLCIKLSEVRKTKELNYLRPDGKSQVTVEYENNSPKRIHTVLISAQHAPNIERKVLIQDIIEKVIKEVIPPKYLDKDTIFLINPTGRFEIGGPQADTGLTGRKIIVDTYGGYAPHGGGAFSGKDPTKVDRSAAYMARYICKNIVAAGIATECELQLSYAIGIEQPISIFVNTYGSGIIEDSKITELITKLFDLTPKGIIDKLNLRQPIYQKTAAYGHFGKNQFSWEKTDMVDLIKKRI